MIASPLEPANMPIQSDLSFDDEEELQLLDAWWRAANYLAVGMIYLQDNPLLHEHELNHLRRLIDYLDVVKTPHSDAFERPKLHNDVKSSD
jgi:phosphoketolase